MMATKETKPVNPVKERRRHLYNRYWEEIRSAEALGKKFAYCTNATPIEFVQAMDFIPVFPSNVSATCSAFKVATEMCEAAEAEGYPTDLCSYGRTQIGDILLGDKSPSPIGRLPEPSLLITGCHDHIMIKWFEQISRIYNAPMIVIDVPFAHDDTGQAEKEMGYKYIEEQVWELVTFLQDFTGRPFNWERLKELVTATRNSYKLCQQILELRRFIPSPFNAWDLFSDLLFPARVLRGWPEATDFYEFALKYYTERVEKGVGTIPDEKYRLHFDGLPPWFRVGFIAKTLASYGAIPLSGPYELSLHFEDLDPEKPIESYAANVGRHYNLEGTVSKINDIAGLVKKHSLDGQIIVWSRTCRVFTIGMRDRIEILKERTGIPSVIIECDTCDARLTSDEHISQALESFMEVLAASKNGKD
jgi:benzoyl-CoA reductase subunit B